MASFRLSAYFSTVFRPTNRHGKNDGMTTEWWGTPSTPLSRCLQTPWSGNNKKMEKTVELCSGFNRLAIGNSSMHMIGCRKIPERDCKWTAAVVRCRITLLLVILRAPPASKQPSFLCHWSSRGSRVVSVLVEFLAFTQNDRYVAATTKKNRSDAVCFSLAVRRCDVSRRLPAIVSIKLSLSRCVCALSRRSLWSVNVNI